MQFKNIESIIIETYNEAKKRNHKFVCLEHLLFVLLYDHSVCKVVDFCNANVANIKMQVDKYLISRIKTSPKNTDQPTHTEAIKRIINRLTKFEKQEEETKMSAYVQHQLYESLRLKDFEIDENTILIVDDSIKLLLFILEEKDSHANYFLQTHGINIQEIMEYIIKNHLSPTSFEHHQEKPSSRDKFKNLNKFATNLIEKAAQGKIDPLVGRKNELIRITQILCRRKKNNPVLIGEPGVGKSSVIEGLAYKIYHGQVHPVLKNFVIYTLDIASLVAGTKYRGDFEQRFNLILDELRDNPNVIIFIDEIHNIIGAGSTFSGTLDASNLLKPALANGEIKCIGATTYKEFKNVFEKDIALLRRFQKIDIEEPSQLETLDILRGIKKNYEEFYSVEYTDEALKCAVDLSCLYFGNRFLPDKAIDILDETGSSFLLNDSKDKPHKITAELVKKTIKLMGHMPEYNKGDNLKLVQSLSVDLKKVIFGQDKVIEKLAFSIKRNKAGLGNSRPIGSFLFCGPTGVGKTEISKQLANAMSLKFLRFDMSEYMEKHSVSRLIGAPPGYVGYEQRGLLTNEVAKHPYCVVLLDEFEKAHPDIYNLFLQIMDYGNITDNSGEKINFNNAIIIMTSNVGTKSIQTIGFEGLQVTKEKKAVNQEFSAEFLNRLDEVIYFNHLSEENIMNIVEKTLMNLRLKLKAKKINLKVNLSAKKWLAKNGYSTQYGARYLENLVQKEIKNKLSDDILFGELKHGGKVIISNKNNGLVFQIQNLVI